MQPESQFEYDVAFSFLAQDEDLASALNDLLQDRFKTFLYSERQAEIVGRDGEKTFSSVFGERARVVVVLYRPGWGESPWTRIEETAIRNRAYDHDYGFLILIPLTPPTVPPWLPKTRLWLGFERWGLNGAASIIERRIEECGGESREETVVDRAARLQRQIDFDQARARFRGSVEGVESARLAFASLRRQLLERTTDLAKRGGAMSPLSIVEHSQDSVSVFGLGPGLTLDWRVKYRNSLDWSTLYLKVWQSPPSRPGMASYDLPNELASIDFVFDLFPDGTADWFEPQDKRRYSSERLSEVALKLYLDWTDKQIRDHAEREFAC